MATQIQFCLCADLIFRYLPGCCHHTQSVAGQCATGSTSNCETHVGNNSGLANVHRPADQSSVRAPTKRNRKERADRSEGTGNRRKGGGTRQKAIPVECIESGWDKQ